MESNILNVIWPFRMQGNAINLTNAPKGFAHTMNDIFQEYMDHFISI